MNRLQQKKSFFVCAYFVAPDDFYFESVTKSEKWQRLPLLGKEMEKYFQLNMAAEVMTWLDVLQF